MLVSRNTTTPGQARSRAWLVFMLVGAVATCVYMLLPHGLQTYAYDGFGGACVAAIAVGARRLAPAQRRPWLLFGAGLALFVAGDLILSGYSALLGEQPFPSIADLSYLAGYAFLVGGLVAMIHDRNGDGGRSAMLDALIIASGAGVLAWAFWMSSYAGDSALSLPAKLTSLAYPLMDLVLLIGVLRLALGPGERSVGFYLLGTSVLALLAGDVVYGLTSLADSYLAGGFADAAYALSYVLWGATALHPSMRATPAPRRTGDPARPGIRVAALAAASLLGPAVIVIWSLRTRDPDLPVIASGSAIAFLLILARLSGLMRRLKDVAAERARAAEREQSLRRAAGWLVGAGDRETVYHAACAAIAAIAGGSGSHSVAMWRGAPPTVCTVATLGRRADEAALLTLDHEGRDEAAAETLIVPLLVDGRQWGGFTVLSEAPPGSDDLAAIHTMRDQVALALRSIDLFEKLERRRSEQRFASLVEQSSDVITILDDVGLVTFQSASAEHVFGYRDRALIGRPLTDLVHPDERDRVALAFADAWMCPGVSTPVEYRLRRHDGSWCQVESVLNNLCADPEVAGVVVNTRDVTERRQLEQRLLHQAFHDTLTGLANRALFRDRTEHALARSRGELERHAVLFLDLDDFKAINDSLGHAIGDEVLVEVGERLRRCCRETDTASRLGGDEFAVLLEDIDSADDAMRAAERLMDELSQPFDVAGRQVFLSASMGVAVRTGAEQDPGEILRNADIAMYLAKSRGKSRCELFEPAMHDDAVKRLELESDLRRAVEREEFFLEYQPIVDLASGDTKGVEALVRWRHPARGVVPPLDFIEAAESTGLIVPLGRWVLREACRQTRALQDAHPADPPLTINVNLSARQLHDPDLVEDVAAALADTNLPAQSLTLEITETVMMQDAEATVARLEELVALGVHLAVDDFGTGYSSLNYLRRFPIDVLKVAKPFVDDLPADSDRAALAHGIVQLAQSLHLKVVAEGIETPAQAKCLRRMNCDMGQGFSFARPMDVDSLEQLLERPISSAPND